MEIVVALGKIYGAESLVPVKSVQVAGVSYKNLGEAGLSFLEEWAREGAKVRVPTMLNPAGMDLVEWQSLGIPEDFARKQGRVLRAFEGMGIEITCTCTPYLAGHLPSFGEHIAWSESSAVSFANSVLGARTNREGGPSALAAAITGRTAKYGLHLARNRKAGFVIAVRPPLENIADWGALGYVVGRWVENGVPFFAGTVAKWLPTNSLERWDRLKTLGAAMAASGAVALYHVEGVTPEAEMEEVVAPDAKGMVIEDLAEGYSSLNSPAEEIDLVSIGCPHASLAEIERVVQFLRGRKVKTRLWISTSRAMKEQAKEKGWVAEIGAAGGRVLADTCPVVAPLRELGIRTLATNSAKEAFYAPSHSQVAVRFGPWERCLQAALTGRWPGEG